MSRFARLVIQFRWPILAAWVIGAAALVVTAPFGPAFSEHGNTNPLPSSAPELRAEALLQQHFFNQPQQPQSTTFSDYVILVNAHGLSADDRTAAARIMLALRLGISSDALVQVGFPPTPSHDGQALLLPLTWDGRSAGSGQSGHRQAADIISGVQLPAGTTAGYASGSVANDEINRGIDERLPLSLALAVGAVILVLAFIFRSVLGVLAPLLSIGLGSAAGMATLAHAGVHTPLLTASFTPQLVPVVTLGAGTNYSLFLMSRYREELARGLPHREALLLALNRIGSAITASALTVIVATGVMAFAGLELFQEVGPNVAIAIAVMLLCGLTFMPALMAVVGPFMWWPSHPERHTKPARPGFWTRAGRLVVRRPAVIAVVTVLLLIPFAIVGFRSQISFDFVGLLPTGSLSANGYQALEKHFPDTGLDRETLVVVPASSEPAMTTAVKGVSNVSAVDAPTTSPDGQAAMVQFSIGFPSGSTESMQAVGDVTAAVQSALPNHTVLVAGRSAFERDQRNQLGTDLRLIILLASVGIGVILALLIRSVTSPIYLLATIGLSTLSAIGVCQLLYGHLEYTTPIFAFVFLVALGEDFNILLITRLREEVARLGHGEGTVVAVATTGRTLSGCGLVMAGTFGALLTARISVVQQVALVVAFGVLLDTFLIRPLLVPSIAELLGRWNWVWPFSRGRAIDFGSLPR
ncbi:MAG: MMPL family transporter [Chloroflexi bacterium]|nr:MAG: MMPL family transporter [Chloroflexota bacterium]